MRTAVVLAAVVLTATAGTGAAARQLAPADVAAKLSGTWVLNLGLSKGFSAPGRRGGRAGQSGLRFSMAAAVPQGRGGGGGSPSDATDLTPEVRAEQAAMRQLQQIADEIKITATPDSVTFVDTRGERTYAINDKSVKVNVGESAVTVKSKWDKAVLKQEFSNTQAKLIQTWSLDESGHLVLAAKLESMTLRTPEQKAVFDRK